MSRLKETGSSAIACEAARHPKNAIHVRRVGTIREVVFTEAPDKRMFDQSMVNGVRPGSGWKREGGKRRWDLMVFIHSIDHQGSTIMVFETDERITTSNS